MAENVAVATGPFLRLLAGSLGLVLPLILALPQTSDAQAVADSAAILGARAVREYEQGAPANLSRAIELWARALPLERRLGNRRNEGTLFDNIGAAYHELGRLDSALSYFGRAHAVRRKGGSRQDEALTANSIGLVYEDVQKPDSALAWYRTAYAILRTLRDPLNEAVTLHNIGSALAGLGRPDSAIIIFRQVLSIRRQVGDSAGEATTLNALGNELRTLGYPDSAVSAYRRALAIMRGLRDRSGEAISLANLGRVYADQGPPDSALSLYRQALVIQRQVGDRLGEEIALNDIAVVYDVRGQADSALLLYRQSLAMAHERGDRKSEARTMNNIGTVYSALGFPDSAVALFHRALAINREVGDRAGEGTTLGNISYVHGDQGRRDSALTYNYQALAIARAVGGRASEGLALQNIGSGHFNLGRPDSAIVYFRQALAIQREVGDRAGEMATLDNIGAVHRRWGHADSALASHRQALAIAREVGDRPREAMALLGLGVLHYDLGRADSAVAFGSQALAINRATGRRKGEAEALHDIGGFYAGANRPDSALVYYGQALAIEREVGLRVHVGRTLSNLGAVHADLGHADSALSLQQQALAIKREVGDRPGEGAATHNIAAIRAELGRADSALVGFSHALKIMRETGDRAGEAETLNRIGWTHHRARTPPDLRVAVAYYDSAAAVKATVAARSGGEQNRVSYAEQSVGLFRLWTYAWLARSSELGQVPTALAGLAASERGRAQSLLDLMRRTSGDASSGRDLTSEGAGLLAAVTKSGTAVLSYLVTLDTLVLWFAVPGRDVEVIRRAVPHDTLARLVSSLRGAMGVGEATRGRMALRGGDPLDPEPIGVVRGSIGARAVRPGVGSLDAVSRALAELLLPPALDRRLGKVRELAIIAPDVLGLVPFATLPVDSRGTPFGARYALRYAPSLAALGEVEGRSGLPTGGQRTTALQRALVVGNPSMPTTSGFGESFQLDSLSGAAAEAIWLATRLGSAALMGLLATEAEVRRRLPSASIVHLATHGYAYASEARARLSFVALAPSPSHDGFLTVGEVLDDPALMLSADLVVLSACQTGLGDLKQAEGTVGLQRAFLAKGARSVLVSLWSVSDAATSLLMQRFYTHWLDDADGPSKAEALRRAQEEVRKTPGFEAPKYWAAFQLVGAR